MIGGNVKIWYEIYNVDNISGLDPLFQPLRLRG